MKITIPAICIIALSLQSLSAADASEKPNAKPVKIYLVAGQSNAEQRGNIEWTQKNWP